MRSDGTCANFNRAPVLEMDDHLQMLFQTSQNLFRASEILKSESQLARANSEELRTAARCAAPANDNPARVIL